MASERARAAEAASREAQQLNPAVETHQLSQHGSHCHRCGKHGHTGATCIHKDKRCHYCKKVGHLSSVCGRKKSETTKTTPPYKDKKSSKQRKTHLVDVQVDSDSFSDEAFDMSHNHVHHSGCHGRTKKLTATLLLNSTEIRMEIDTGAELSTIPFSVYQEKLSKVKLEPSGVSLHQYDGTPLSVWGEIILNVQKAEQNLVGRFVVVDNVNNQLPLLGRDWLGRVRLNWTKILSDMQLGSVNA